MQNPCYLLPSIFRNRCIGCFYNGVSKFAFNSPCAIVDFYVARLGTFFYNVNTACSNIFRGVK